VPLSFTTGAAAKTRPALVLFDLLLDVIICRITTAVAAGPADVMLADWRTAGLLKPSVASRDRLLTIERTIVLRRIGVLSPVDLAAVRSTWNQHMRL
jgi:mRNA-degrading endonuclease toxin of MazEF toxin-antitoxin module